MAAFFRNVRHYGVRDHDSVKHASVRSLTTAEEREQLDEAARQHKEQLQKVEKSISEFEQKVSKNLVNVEVEEFKHERNRIAVSKTRIGKEINQKEFDQYVVWRKERDELRRYRPPALAEALCVKEHGSTVPDTHILIRGNPHVNGEKVAPRFPQILSPPEPVINPPEHGESSGRRLALANWIASKENPLTARVMANRLWQYHFGRGIVRSTNNFGLQGVSPHTSGAAQLARC